MSVIGSTVTVEERLEKQQQQQQQQQQQSTQLGCPTK
jgi:hypothetical protein